MPASRRPSRHPYPLACLIAGALLLSALPAHDARSEVHDTCAGFIDSIPATITTQGVWCLRHDVSTAITSGAAITVATNNVTIDCNDYKVGGLAAGSGTQAYGISAGLRQNIAVRNCGVRGFRMGISIVGGAGHVVEDNRLDNNYYVGLNITGENSLLRRNRVFDTGSTSASTPVTTYGIFGGGVIVDNLVEGMVSPAGQSMIGIRVVTPGDVVRGNSVKHLVPGVGGAAIGIMGVDKVFILENHVHAGRTIPTTGYGFRYGGICLHNTVQGFVTAYADCAVTGPGANRP